MSVATDLKNIQLRALLQPVDLVQLEDEEDVKVEEEEEAEGVERKVKK